MTETVSRLVERSFQTSVLQTIIDGTVSDSSKGSRFFSVGLSVAFLVYLIFNFNKTIKTLGDADGTQDIILVAFGVFSIFALTTVRTIVNRLIGRSNLRIDSRGVSLWHSLGGAPSLTRKTHLWKDLQFVRFEKNVVGVSSTELLIFDWDSSKQMRLSHTAEMTMIDLSILSPEERADLFACLALFVPQELIAPEALYLQMRALSGDTSGSLYNFTDLWMNEFSSRFSLANYVPLKPGTILGHYVVNMLTASRSNSSVYLAQAENGRRVVIKELTVPVDCGGSEQLKILEQFNREASILARLNHPAIVRIVDHFVESGRSYIVMEMVEGLNLREYLNVYGRLLETRVARIGSQAAAVLAYLHEQQPAVVHRDFTPDNLILDSEDRLTVIDFGAANVFYTGKTATLIGKQNYMPPEQLRGKACPASDIYSLGATLAFLLSGKDLPAMGRLPDFDKVECSPEFQDILRRCISFEPEERPTAHQLESLLKDSAALAERSR